MQRKTRVQKLIQDTQAELLDAQECAESGRVRDMFTEAGLRAKLFALRSEKAALDGDLPLAMKLAKTEKELRHEARQIGKQLIADELAQLRAYVLEGSELEDSLEPLPEKLTPCDPDPSGSASASSPSSETPSRGDSSTSP